MKSILFAAVIALALGAPVHAQEALPYTEGAVVEVTSVDIMDGEFDHYMEYLQTKYKPRMEAQKKAGIILDYGVYQNQTGKDEDADLYLVVFYPNMAALDGLRERVDPLMTKVSGESVSQANTAFAARGKMRNIMGNELLRELKLK
ncbi:hypothetical protein [Lysobacter solisilvae (ex Woo and Kim 2020)]|uniref:DUF1330 domain-containing protein n=1 Tax=Agrilutibacter terrestris TaxID=2865112 RepID=A0A7H0FWV6_9GAMM|nr:hypothetical protein [Lysobacter terrestris]QNP40522.1 hypothetical protein H8B22_13805 [Lysobacter terrestris]